MSILNSNERDREMTDNLNEREREMRINNV